MTYAPADFADLRGLSLRQPYADLVAFDEKRVETRGRDLGAQVGQVLAIQASQRPFDYDECEGAWARRLRYSEEHGDAPNGAIVCVARVVAVAVVSEALFGGRGVVRYRVVRGDGAAVHRAISGRESAELECGDWSDGRSLIVLADVVRLAKPVPCRGMLGLWRVPDAQRDAVREQVAA